MDAHVIAFCGLSPTLFLTYRCRPLAKLVLGNISGSNDVCHTSLPPRAGIQRSCGGGVVVSIGGPSAEHRSSLTSASPEVSPVGLCPPSDSDTTTIIVLPLHKWLFYRSNSSYISGFLFFMYSISQIKYIMTIKITVPTIIFNTHVQVHTN